MGEKIKSDWLSVLDGLDVILVIALGVFTLWACGAAAVKASPVFWVPFGINVIVYGIIVYKMFKKKFKTEE